MSPFQIWFLHYKNGVIGDHNLVYDISCVRDQRPGHRRRADSAEVRLLIDEVYRLMTSATHAAGTVDSPAKPHLSDRLPEAEVGRMESLLELLDESIVRLEQEAPSAVPRLIDRWLGHGLAYGEV